MTAKRSKAKFSIKNGWFKRAKSFWLEYQKNKAAVISLILFAFIIFVAIFAPLLAPYDPLSTEMRALVPPSAGNPLGTDDLGRDILSGVLYGTRVSLTIGTLSALISALIGILAGAVAGYYGGLADNLLMRVADFFVIIPSFVLAIVIIAIYGQTVWNIILTICLMTWPSTARIVRAEFLSLKEREFVEAARVLGLSNLSIIFSEILPNALGPTIVNTTFQIAHSILLESSLSFLGLQDPNVISCGLMLRRSMQFLREAWWMFSFPGITLFLIILIINIVGDGLSEALNPYLRSR